ncbi:MAG TPA: hypothetical protein VKA84_25905, partial [Gemmatimonadaceae bacterium]|nr:hypothetical protein [Gemmatimonadaceae bacterium]
MSRLLLHPLEDGGNVTRVPPGQWVELKQPDSVREIKLTEATDRRRRGRISSVPSPWARLQIFRDAVLDPAHPFHDEALNDVLDTVELVLFQKHLAGVSLVPEKVELEEVLRQAQATQNPGVARFAAALRDLAPEVDRARGARLPSLTVLRNGATADAPIVCATSPFTLFFTPETRRWRLPGYYTGPGPLRPLSARPPALARYVAQQLLPQLGSGEAGRQPELQKLRTVLLEQARAVPGSERAFGDGDPALTEVPIEPAAGIVMHAIAGLPGTSSLAVKGTRQPPMHARAPLVLDNSGRASQGSYFPWLARPAGTVVDPATDRTVLPNTGWRHEWLYPETDFLADKLLVLDTPLVPQRVRAAAGDAQGPASDAQRAALQVLPPLKPRFFEFFRAEDVPRMLELRVQAQPGGVPRVLATLTVDTEGGPLTVQREYAGHAQIDSHLSLWPGFAPKDAAFAWRDYYLMHHMYGGAAREEVAVEVSAGGRPVELQEYERAGDTVVYHFASPPEVVHLRSRRAPLGDPRVAEGAVLPALRMLDAPRNAAWSVAIDFGTSNTTVAVREPGQPPAPFTVREAGRFDLTQAPAGDGARVIPTYFDSFFFPTALEPKPFGTIIYKSRGVDVESPIAGVPALTANVPFRGEIMAADPQATSPTGNQVCGDLKWGGAGEDSERLSKLFLHQVLQVIHAEAIARGVRTDGFEFRWSYPIAFSKKRQQIAAARWKTLVEQFRADRFQAAPVASLERDESSASLLFFTADPAAQGQFTEYAPNVKLTVDVGGGTTDVAARARGRTLFLTSMLFGGRDLIGGEIYKRVDEWARRRQLPAVPRTVLDAYPSSHTRFNYLVRLPWFAQNAPSLAEEPWFTGVQLCILYFYSAIMYNVGLRLRGVKDEDVDPADMMFVAGNGSSYLNWLTVFAPWDGSPLKPAFAGVLQGALEAGYGRPLGHPLSIHASSRPKQEVALGLLIAEGADAAAHAPQPPMYSPAGERVALPQQGGGARTLAPDDAMDGTMLSAGGIGGLRFELPFDQWEISA